jgi:cyclophilin family peptidyl-prolyl cis-trans isomerase
MTSSRPTRSIARLRCEALEAREVPAVTLAEIPSQPIPNDKPIFFPLTVTNSPNGDAVSYSVEVIGPAGLTAEIIQGGRTIVLDVTGIDNNGDPFAGTLKFRLFEDVAPLATGLIIQLTEAGFYDGKLFHRVLPGFVIQGGSPNGDGIGGSSLPDVDDEFHRDYTFASPGIVAMANARDDNNNSQFFITDPTVNLSNRPQFLNFNHTIVGILTSGFDIYDKIINTPTTFANGEMSFPIHPVTITSASVITDTINAVLKLTPSPGFSGPATITITPQDDDPEPSTPIAFNATAVDDGSNSRPFILDAQLPTNLSTPSGVPISFFIPFLDVDGDPVTFAVRNETFSEPPANLNVQIDQATGKVTLTPINGFVGTIQFRVGVRDSALRSGTNLNAAGNFDTQLMSLTVTEAPPSPPPVSPPPVSPPPVSPPPVSPPVTDPPLAGPPVTDPPVINPPETDPPAIPISLPPPPAGPVTVTGSPAGSEPRIIIRNADGSERFNILVYESTFTGGVIVVLADVTGDGREDAVVVPGFGGAPLLKVFDTQTGELVFSRMVFEDTFRGGLSVDVGDTTGAGYSQIIVGAGNSGGPRITLLDAKTGQTLQNFFAFDSTLRGGVTASLAVLKAGPAKVQLIAVGGPGAGPQVSVYDAQSLRLLGTTMVGDPEDRTGLSLRVGDPDTDGDRNLFVRPFGSTATEQEIDPDTFIDFNSVLVG